MKIFISTFLTLLSLSLMSTAELLENGDFSNGVNYWTINRAKEYGRVTGASVTDGELHLSNLTEGHAGYLNVVQSIDIQESKTYRLTYEVKGPVGASYGCSIGDHRKGGHVANKGHKITGTDWEKISVDLVARVTTDSSWYNDHRKATRKNELAKDGVTERPKKPAEKPNDSGSTVLAFGLGKIQGQVALRNISLVPVE